MVNLVEVVPLILGVGAIARMIRETIRKYRTRSDLSTAMNESDVIKVGRLLNENKLDAAADVVRGYAKGLSSGEQGEAESALRQRSDMGRAGYIREVAAGSVAGKSRR